MKSPLVKGIIKAATLKTFEEFCGDYLGVLRGQIGALGSGSGKAGAGEEKEKEKEKENDGADGDGEGLTEAVIKEEESPATLNWKSILVHALLVILSFVIGYYVKCTKQSSTQGYCTPSRTTHTTHSHSHRRFVNKHLSRSHARLQSLRPDLSALRGSLLRALERVDELEGRVVRAQEVAVIGDQLLACARGAGQGCKELKGEWERLLHE